MDLVEITAMILLDKSKRTARISVRAVGDKLLMFDHEALPKIKEDAIGILTLPAASIVDEKKREELEAESVIELLPKGTGVLVGLSLEMMPVPLRREFPSSSDLKIPVGGYCFAEVHLSEPLMLRLRGDKDPCLEDCRCFIPILNAEARSLNHAFTLLSVKYETKRISHTGNVFTRTFLQTNEGRWRSLNEARGYLDTSPL
jgi:hypothetical protein